MGIKARMKGLVLCMCLFLQLPSACAQCANESPIPPTVPPTSWTAWYNVDNPDDGTDDETHAAVKAVHPAVCPTPTQANCRVRFLHTDHVTAGQTLVTGCSPTGGLLCRDADQADSRRCLDYEIRFQCPTSNDAFPEPHFHWDMSTKTSVDADEPVTCVGTVSSIYPTAGGMTGIIGGTLDVTDSFDSSDHLCAVRNQKAGWINYGSGNDRCISEPVCCTSGFTMTFWMRNRTPAFTPTTIIMSTGGHASKARGLALYLGDYITFDVRGFVTSQAFKLNVMSYFPDDQWTHHSFTYEPGVGANYYKDGVFVETTDTVEIGGSSASNYDDVVMFSRNNDPSGWPLELIDGDFSNFKMFYKAFNETEVQNAYLQETSESKLLIHYLRKHSHEDSFGVELECLAKAGSQPTIVWHRSVDGAHFEPVSSSADVAIYESSPNSYRRRSILVARDLSFSSDVIFVCEAVDTARGGSVSKRVTIPKRVMYWTPWLSADNTLDGDDRETLIKQRQKYDLLCKYPSDIECRTVYDGLPSNETGQVLNISCTLSSGLECRGADQSAEHGYWCYDYKVRYQCPEPLNRWTPWYDAKDPDGAVEDETLATHTSLAYPDLCSQPIGAECRLKASKQDLLASGFVPEVPYLCNANGFRCQHADNTGSCPDFEVRYRCPDSTALESISVDGLRQESHHLNPDLRLTCTATVGSPTVGSFRMEWARFDPETPRPAAAAPLASGGIISIDSNVSPSVMTIDNFVSSTLANTSLVCIARDDVFVDAKTIAISLPSFCELPVGVSSGEVGVVQITPSTVKSSPFKVPGVNGLDPWVPTTSDANQWLDFDLGVDFAITGIAVQGDPDNSPPINHVQEFSLRAKANEDDSWVLYTDARGMSVFNSNYSEGPTSFTTLTPNITTRFLRFSPKLWNNEIMVRVEIYGCAVGESTLRIVQLSKHYDVVGNNFTLTCLTEHYPVPNVTWLADGSPVSPVQGVWEISDTIDTFPTRVSTLTLIGFRPDLDNVTFTCVAQSGIKVEKANISTQYKFQGIVTVSSDQTPYYGSDVIITCVASDDDIYVMEWGHRTAATSDPFTIVRSSGRYLIAKIVNNATSWQSTLTISRFIQSDEGEYACLVNSDTARDTSVVVGKSGLRKVWANATFDQGTNSYQLECAVSYPNIEPDVIWVIPNGDGVNHTTSKYQIQNNLFVVVGNLTKVSRLTVHHYSFSQDDGTYRCSFTAAGQVVNITLEARFAYNGSISASVTKPVQGQPVRFICTADDVDHVHHADWLRVVGNDRLRIENDVIHSVYEDRSGGVFRLHVDLNPYSGTEDGDYVCSVNNGTGEATVTLSGQLALTGRGEDALP
ncbi:uncharacterized protein LOC110979373 isoform X2 [Acanthaster planci]|uniref:Uncharacterized protein LOC110979373 isoform X2 n=1 Tax=Acanthaster planci TaxID=133434 RepID=A0A8B7YC52_ACAPL|nr:uncharacterized protein LOC110979373 isoform X2 [Acanthaster planci]